MKKGVKLVSAVMCAVMAISSVSGVGVSATGTNGNGSIIADFDMSQSYDEWLEDYNINDTYSISDAFVYDTRYKLITKGGESKIMDVEKKHTVSGFIKTNLGVFYALSKDCVLYNGVIKSGNKYYICNTGLLDGKFYTKEDAKKKEGIRCTITDGPNKGKVFVATPYTENSIKLFKSTYKDLKRSAVTVMGTGVRTAYYKTMNGIACTDKAMRTDAFSRDYNVIYSKGKGIARIVTGKCEDNDYKYNIYIKYLKNGKVYKKEMGILGTDKDGALMFSWTIPETVTMGAIYVETESMIATFGFGDLNTTKEFKNAVAKCEMAKGFFVYTLDNYYQDILV